MWAVATRAGRTTLSIPSSFAAERTRTAAASSVPQTSTLRPAQRKVRSQSRESGTCSRSASNRNCSGSRDRFATTSTSKSLMLSSFRSYTRGQKTCRELFRRSSVSNCRQRRAETSGSKGSSQQARGCVRLWGLDGARARPSQQCYSGSASEREHHPNCASGRERFCPAAVVGAHERDRQSCGDGRVAERQRDVPDLEIFPHHRPELRGGGPRGGGRAEPDDIAAVEQHRRVEVPPKHSHTISSLQHFEIGLPEWGRPRWDPSFACLQREFTGRDLAHNLLPQPPPWRIPFDRSTRRRSSSLPPAPPVALSHGPRDKTNHMPGGILARAVRQS